MTVQSLLPLNIGLCLIMIGIFLLGGLIGWYLKKWHFRRKANLSLQWRDNYWHRSFERLAELEADKISLLLEQARAK